MELSVPAYRRVVWIGASLVVAGTMLVIAHGKGLFRNPDTRVFELSVFFGAWLAIALLMRSFVNRKVRDANDAGIDALFKRDDDPPKR